MPVLSIGTHPSASSVPPQASGTPLPSSSDTRRIHTFPGTLRTAERPPQQVTQALPNASPALAIPSVQGPRDRGLPIDSPPNDLALPQNMDRRQRHAPSPELTAKARELAASIRDFHEKGRWNTIFEPTHRTNVLRAHGIAYLMAAIRGGLELAWTHTANDDYNESAQIPQIPFAVFRMFRELDFEGSAVFARDVRLLTRKPEVQKYLRDLTHFLADPEKQLNLWNFTLEHTHGDQAEAIRWLAVLFQDLDPGPTGQLALVDSPPTQELLTLANLMLSLNHGRVTFYPTDFGWHDHLLYHFYVPAYAAIRLRKAGYAADQSFVPPFVMNSEYERIYLETSDDGKPGVDSMREVLSGTLTAQAGPKKNFNSLRVQSRFVKQSIRDIYLGYRGALLGSGSTAKPMNYSRFEQGMRHNTRQTLVRVVTDVHRAPALRKDRPQQGH